MSLKTKKRGPRGQSSRHKVSQSATKSPSEPTLQCGGLTELPLEDYVKPPVIGALGLVPVPAQPPTFYPLPELPVTSPSAVLVLVLGAAAVSVLVERLLIKKQPIVSDREASNRVIKLSDAYKVIDKVCTSQREVLEIGIRYAAAIWHANSPHTPKWLSFDQAADDFNEEIMNHVMVKLKDGMALKVLQQCNRRQQGTWTTIDMGEIETLKLRLGKLHPR